MARDEVQESKILQIGSQIGTVGLQTLFVVVDCALQCKFGVAKIFQVLIAYREIAEVGREPRVLLTIKLSPDSQRPHPMF